MTLPINMKFEVPKLKAPAPTRTPLWPTLTPPPTTTAAAKPAGKGEAGRPMRPITVGASTSGRPGDGRRRRGLFHRRSLFMRLALPAIPLLSLVSILAGGCATEPPAPAATSPLDVPRPAAVAAAEPAVTPPPAPVAKPTAAKPTPAAKPAASKPAMPPIAPAAVAPAAAAGAETYVVKPGDTLFHIAKARYGDGNLWKKIAAANPGLSPSTIKVGQKITIPA